MRPVVALENVGKVYDTGEVKVPALRGVSLTVLPAEFVAIIGASGSGKSTLMNIIGCLDRPTTGTYRFDGQDVSRLDRKDLAHIRNRKLGFVFQGFNLLKRQSAVENVELPLAVRRHVAARDAASGPWRCCELVGPGATGRTIRRTSCPAASSSAWPSPAPWSIGRRSCWPTSRPATSTRRHGAEILAEFERLNREHGQTIIMVTHDPAVAAHAARVVTVRDGLIASDESPSP